MTREVEFDPEQAQDERSPKCDKPVDNDNELPSSTSLAYTRDDKQVTESFTLPGHARMSEELPNSAR
ncbi:MAG: hypothetical protein CMA59_01080 [Euryarchaeota archaeon]|nr:hypothetical protein [Euryarchaeota archaeon]